MNGYLSADTSSNATQILQDHLEIRAQDGTKLFLNSTSNKGRLDEEDSDADSEAGPDPEASPIKLTCIGRKRCVFLSL